jgi:dethiobiotin synthetase
MTRGWFVTGTDTGVGKTRASSGLIRALRQRGLRAHGMKPVASGSERSAAGLRNEDALALISASGLACAYEDVNPYAFEPAVAPHIAAAAAGVTIAFDSIGSAYQRLAAAADHVVVEGAGGWRVPLGPTTFLSDLVRYLQLDVILVVGLRLGCLNHAILTAEAVERLDGLRLIGWIGSALDADMPNIGDNIATLRHALTAPCVGILPHEPAGDPDRIAAALDLSVIAELPRRRLA